MKWLFQFAVVSFDASGGFERSCADVIDGKARVREMEERIARLLRDRPDCLLAYRAVLDRQALHRELAFWLISRIPGLFTDWRMYVTYGVLCLAPARERYLQAPPPRRRELSRAAGGLDGATGVAFLEAFFDGLASARAARGLLVMTARILGSRGD